MQKRVRCPCCGMLAWRSQIEKSHNIDVLQQNQSKRPKGSGGFKYTKSESPGLVALVKAKIKSLYEKYFDPVHPSITVLPHFRVATPVLAKPVFRAKPGLLIMPVVKT